ncbi:biliverdin-producing heme oxygenase [Marinospirillum sp.]|uniref:biliverdin-producing heme oxygenase n=1 Tax=Marinospirillum sp. TaxID=2183934 RepID=UPI00384FAFF4
MSLIHLPQLRRATHDLHEKLETLPALKRLLHPSLSLQEYRDFLQCFFQLHLQLEKQIYPYFCHLTPDEFHWEHFMASPRLAKDLIHLCQPLPQPDETKIPTLTTSLPEALGCCYVLLGSGFGARQIAPLLRKHLGELVPLSFYEEGQPYLKRLWHQLEKLLSIYSSAQSEQQQTQTAAQNTFQLFHHRLSQLSQSSQYEALPQ